MSLLDEFDGDEDHEEHEFVDEFDDEDRERLFMFADPGSKSALRAETPDNPRDRPCPSCGTPNVLTRKDVALGYQCNACADRDEQGGP